MVKQWTEPSQESEISAFVNINLYVKHNGEWSEPIPGTGGSSLMTKEKNGLYTNDECYKMALTDAISVACKALGVGADIYWGQDSTKYAKNENNKPEDKQQKNNKSEPIICADCGKEVTPVNFTNGQVWKPDDVKAYSLKEYGRCMCWKCIEKEQAAQKKRGASA
jgi:hypothetical protein